MHNTAICNVHQNILKKMSPKKHTLLKRSIIPAPNSSRTCKVLTNHLQLFEEANFFWKTTIYFCNQVPAGKPQLLLCILSSAWGQVWLAAWNERTSFVSANDEVPHWSELFAMCSSPNSILWWHLWSSFQRVCPLLGVLPYFEVCDLFWCINWSRGILKKQDLLWITRFWIICKLRLYTK